MSSSGSYRWIIRLAIVIALFELLPSTFIERYYSGWLYLKIHTALHWVFGFLPFPGYYLVIALAIIYVLKWLSTLFSGRTLMEKIARISGHIAKWAVWFFVLWGFNYGRVPVEKKLKLEIRQLTREELITEIDTVSKELVQLRRQLEEDTVPIPEEKFHYQNEAGDMLAYTLNQWQYGTVKVKGRELKEDMLLRFDVGGQYMPYTGEANIDKGVHYYSKPFYMVHEMCHANGFCDEATCNFMSYVVASNFNNKGFQYSVQINYLKYLLTDLYSLDSSTCLHLKKNFPVLLKYDLELMKKHTLKHTFKSSAIGEAINNTYLKLMGVKEGTHNYNKMVPLVYAWRHREDTLNE